MPQFDLISVQNLSHKSFFLQLWAQLFLENLGTQQQAKKLTAKHRYLLPGT